ncbi:3-phosphoshikimate 1-carboxyvinyltransferase [Methanosphaerula palustris]|uniref:3-phosphoshikimate 1-carboxyvinyltransferase n=1 Tax=Methanosphaerula palustris (strain ATCC BAA-1556 / DSM 19958 / E1-9c) TaxID=521011 RepID=AROA_METPE|nr:3-phosphoshikimate 1-carboxyvinyltransferase [Methanosphaerula palustris]B8GF70.1 RecName: Full=3-phosphoshikimate 1-carboxyvinyltransferase; AltName: Full=5-enolpyruvylshikimate-3-phosphate synthase; Short=EPSP synthase; Short=EPSPS [Methanosphaerula palustris E1-9c]ACL17876.1 3-phosphoshikimate 1-carboxyvinyltransferase [Methanosphaerula palustris E1-9c]
MDQTLQQHGPVDLAFTAPPSKSFTHRALIIAALADGESLIRGPLIAEDTLLTVRALQALGADITDTPEGYRVQGTDGRPDCAEGTVLDLKNSGTSLRLLSSIALLCSSTAGVTLTGSPRMQQRPIGELGDAIRTLGGSVRYLAADGYPPCVVQGPLVGGEATLDGSVSSQFISSLLLAAPYAVRPVDLKVARQPVSRSYLEITGAVMAAFGVPVRRVGYTHFTVQPARYRGREYTVEGDYSSASYFFALAATLGGKVTVRNLNHDSVQGDRLFVAALKAMGCRVTRETDGVTIERTKNLHGISIDMTTAPDTVQTLAVVAALADSPTTITGVGHLQYKESDRVAVTAGTLRALGCTVDISADAITIHPGPLHGGVIDPHDDHRTAMAFAVLGLAVGDVTIEDPACVGKSFPKFWNALAAGGLL